MQLLNLFLSALILSALGLHSGARAAEPDPFEMADETWITINGTVDIVEENRFVLDYGEGTIAIEMDDGDRDADAYRLVKGDKVTVRGRIDDDFFETTTIEAASVYVENIDTTFFASVEDESDFEIFDSASGPPLEIAKTVVHGSVSEVDANEFVIDTGNRSVRVDVSGLENNPLDDEGYPKIGEGDRVKVVGQVNVDLFEGRRFKADRVIKLYSSSN